MAAPWKHGGTYYGKGSAAKQWAKKDAHVQKHRDAFAAVAGRAEPDAVIAPAILVCSSSKCGVERVDRVGAPEPTCPKCKAPARRDLLTPRAAS